MVIATGNAGKLREFRELLGDLPFNIVAQEAFGIAPLLETGQTFLANALLKARHAAGTAGTAALADDSGLEVDALGGAPGVYSARYAGPDAGDGANNAKLQAELAKFGGHAWSARYRCVLAFVRHAADPLPLTAEATWEGRIVDVPSGSAGFGYDRYFFLPELDRTAAELSSAEKNARSHRARALRQLAAQILRIPVGAPRCN